MTFSSASISVLTLFGLALVMVVYWPGLSGPFLLDDFWNLASLGDNGGTGSGAQWLRYVLEGTSGPLGRPLSLASFTLNSSSWPADPWPFKFTNLLIHSVNSLLVILLSSRLFAIAGVKHAKYLAVASGLLWALHPQHVSTVLYAVQRMTQLSALFTLLGLLCFVHGRVTCPRSPVAGYAWIAVGIAGCGVLATLSKENGVLLPLYALILEATLLARLRQQPPNGWRWGSFLLLRMPLYGALIYLCLTTSSWLDGYLARDFTLTERVATQGSILSGYAFRFFLPSITDSGLFASTNADDYLGWRAATGWLMIGSVFVLALALRRSLPMFAMGVLWFLAGHALESSILPLELQFEHRNYLPAAGLAWIGPYLLAQTAGGRIQIATWCAASLVLAGMTYAQSRVWGHELTAAAVWPAEQPGSLRAAQFALGVWQRLGDPQASRNAIEDYLAHHPNHPVAMLHRLELQCQSGESTLETSASLVKTLGSAAFVNGMQSSLRSIANMRKQGHCLDLTWLRLGLMVTLLAENPKLASRPVAVGELWLLFGQLHAWQGDFAYAIAIAEKATATGSGVNAAYWQALWAVEAGDLGAAELYADRARAAAIGRFFAVNPPPNYLEALSNAVLEAHSREPAN